MNKLIRWTSPVPGRAVTSPRREIVAQPTASPFLAAELAKMGQMRRVKAAPTSAALITLPFYCSDNGQPFFVTLGRDRPNEPYHIKSLERTYTGLLSASGYLLGQARGRSISLSECDWTGFQCTHCGVGSCVGHSHDWIYCSVHQFPFCGNRVEAIHGGGFKCRCPACACWSMVSENGTEALSGVGYVVSKPTASLPVPVRRGWS